MPEKVKTREGTAPQQLLSEVVEIRSSLVSLLNEERRRLRRIPLDDSVAVADSTRIPSSARSTEDASPSLVAVRPESGVDRESGARSAALESAERRSRIAAGPENTAATAPKGRDDHESGRPENPRKRLDELAKLLDRRAKQSAESVLKASESREAER